MFSDVDLLAVLLKAAPTLDDTLQSGCFYTLCRQVDEDAAAAKMAKLLLPHCSSITSADTGVGVRVLMLALANVGEVDGGCDVHSKCSAGNYAVHWAARSGSLSVMKWLQSQGLNPRQLSDAGLLPLHWACESNQLAMAKYLLDLPGAAADVHLQSSTSKKSPLHYAVPFESVVQLLLQRGADVHARDER
eukprot:3535-Heterococcus_DN1.PRE.1